MPQAESVVGVVSLQVDGDPSQFLHRGIEAPGKISISRAGRPLHRAHRKDIRSRDDVLSTPPPSRCPPGDVDLPIMSVASLRREGRAAGLFDDMAQRDHRTLTVAKLLALDEPDLVPGFRGELGVRVVFNIF